MADNYLLFSEVIANLNTDEEAWLRCQLQPIAVRDGEELEIDDLDDEAAADAEWVGPRFLKDKEDYDSSCDEMGFHWAFHDDHRTPNGWGRHLWVYTEENGDPVNVAWLARKFLKRFRANQTWSLTWATTCSKPRAGEFGGGAVFVTADHIDSHNACDFLENRAASLRRLKETARLVEKASALRIDPTDLDDAVRNAASVSASAISNSGLDAQVAFLVEQLGMAEAERQIAQASGASGRRRR